VAITLTQPTSGYIGQGIRLYGHTDQGIAGTTAECFITVADFALGLQATDAHGFIVLPNFALLLGLDAATGGFQTPQNGLDLGHGVSVQVTIVQPFPVVLDNQTFGGFFHDPISGISSLLGLVAGQVHIPAPGGPALAGLKLSTADPSVLANPFSGTGTLFSSGGAHTPAGIQWQIASAPSGAGQELGSLPIYEERALQLVAYYQLGDLAYVPDITENQHEAQGISLFDRAVPDHIDYWIAPGYTVNFWWLIPV
jgi:hypothetical protein